MKSKNFFLYGLIIILVFNSIALFVSDASFSFQIERNNFNAKSNAVDQSWSIPLDNFGRDMAIDSNSCIYIVGSDYLMKYNSSGVQLWNKKLGGIFHEPKIKSDSNNNLYLAGFYTNQTLPWNATIFKFKSSGDLQWQTICKYDHISDIAVDLDDNIYIYGSLEVKIMIMKYNESGNQIWLHEVEEMGYGLNILIDSKYNIVISGISSSTYWLKSYNMSRELQWSITRECKSFPLLGLDSSNNVISIVSDCRKLYLIKCDNSGNPFWNYTLESRFLDLIPYGGPPTLMEYRFKLTLDSSNDIYIGWSIEIPNDSYATDALIIKINSSGNFEWYLTWGDSKSNSLVKIGTDSNDNIYLLTGSYLVKNPISNGKSLNRTNLFTFYLILFGISCTISLISLYFIIRSRVRKSSNN